MPGKELSNYNIAFAAGPNFPEYDPNIESFLRSLRGIFLVLSPSGVLYFHVSRFGKNVVCNGRNGRRAIQVSGLLENLGAHFEISSLQPIDITGLGDEVYGMKIFRFHNGVDILDALTDLVEREGMFEEFYCMDEVKKDIWEKSV